MTVHDPRSRPPRFCSPALRIAALALLLAPSARAAVHTVNFDTCAASSPDCIASPGLCTNIPAFFNVAINDTIAGINTGGNPVTWSFDVPPAALGCMGAAPAITCFGVTVNTSGDPVTVAGANPTKGTFSFALQGTAGPKTCFAGFKVTVSQPFDLVAVLDRSGSMDSLKIPGNMAAGTRWEDLKSAVTSLMGLIGTGTCKADGRFGMTLFATKVFDNADPDPTLHYNDADFDNNLLAANLAGLTGKVNAELTSQSPGGFTAMGQGLAEGILNLSDNAPPVTPAPPNRSRTVMLFSDGVQNRDPKVNPATGTHYTNNGVVGAQIAPAPGGPFRIVSVGIGQPAGDYHLALSRAATAHGGSYFATNDFDAAGIETQLDLATQELLKGCSPQLVASYSGALSGSVGLLPPFDVNKGVDQLIIKLSYSRRFETPQLAQLLAGFRVEKDGTDVTKFFRPVILGSFSNTVLLTTDFVSPQDGTTIPPEGSYTITLAEHPEIRDLDFDVVVFADDKNLAMDWQVTPAAPRAQGTLGLSVSLSWMGIPLTGATVEADVRVPGDDLGDALAKDPLTVDVSGAPDAGSPGYQKYRALLEDAAFRSQLQPGSQPLVLQDQGDGTYTASRPLGDVSGVYDVDLRVTADQPFGKVQRLARQSVYVSFADVDLGASAVTTTADAGGVTIDFRPRTGYGRFIGPAQAGAISVVGAGISLADVTDHQDGRYTVRLDGDPDAEIVVNMLDENVYTGPASGFGPTDDGDGVKAKGWWFWLIVLIVLLLLIWLIKKLFK